MIGSFNSSLRQTYKHFIFLVSALLVSLFAVSCSSDKYSIYQFDNGDDYFCEGVRRIVDRSGKIGFADEKGKVVIKPRFAFSFPFENGVAKATMEGYNVPEGEYKRWVSPEWFYIDHNGDMISTDTATNERLDGYESGNDEVKFKIESRYPEMETRLKTFVEGKDARIGIAVIVDGKDTVSVNGNRAFPMLSVYKFPQAIAVADFCLKNNVRVNDTVDIKSGEIKSDTWSPLREKYGVADLRLPLSELLAFSLQQSDNNACDILFRLIGGTHVADSVIKSQGFNNIVIASTEDEMHQDLYLCYQNRSTPIEMARLFDSFYRLDMRNDSPVYEEIGSLLLSCTTGVNRLALPLKNTGVLIGHKTGTGDRNSQGRIIGVNDAGYVFLPDGHGYAIAVFVADSAYDMEETERIIPEISAIVVRSLFAGVTPGVAPAP